MEKFNTRNRILIVSTLLTFFYIVFQQTDFRSILNFEYSFDPIKPFLLAILTYLGVFWALSFKVKGERLITILLFPAIAVFSISLFAELIIITVFSQLGLISIILGSSIFFWVFTYITLLTVNILNASYFQDLPLAQAARASQFVLTLIISYFLYLLLFSNDIFIVIRLALLFVFTALLVYIALCNTEDNYKKRIIVSLALGLLLFFIGAVLSVWPVPAPYLSLALSLVLYITLGIALEIREYISRWIWIENISLFFLIVLLLFIVAEWGINGALF